MGCGLCPCIERTAVPSRAPTSLRSPTSKVRPPNAAHLQAKIHSKVNFLLICLQMCIFCSTFARFCVTLSRSAIDAYRTRLGELETLNASALPTN